MIGILSEEVNSKFLKTLGLEYVYLDRKRDIDIDGLFIDWVPKLPYSEDAWHKQASFLQANVKSGMPIVIFDRYFYLSEKEVNWVKKFNVSLFEPALHSGRTGFGYLPEWIDDLNMRTYDAEYDLIYSGIDYNIPEFEKWIVEYSTLFPNKKVAYSAMNLSSEFKKEEYKKKNLIEVDVESGYSKGKTTMVLDRKESYEKGYLNKMYFYAMKSGCLPFLPIQHKYFHGLFKGLIVENLNELDLNVTMFGKLREVIIEEILERVKEEWSEFTLYHATDVLRNILK